ncbi:MAG TPA: polyprenyl synthetase family protein [Bacteroidales bacterium]|nr:polyprenyl synthetase family protein [Bacteroidales bacterium]HRZ77711.1 polyprenyl synthetase family protein [Bacteroidales bacterium]
MHDLDHYSALAAEALAAVGLHGQPDGLYEPVRYIMALGGKRLRPAMALAACELCGGDPKVAYGPAAGLELFHNFTLLHDDIMDAAPIRRGQPTVHVRWDANRAILSGDTMFALAGRSLLDTPTDAIPELLRLFFDTAVEVCEGQQMDMDFEHRDDVSVEEYLEMIRLKTAVLIAASLRTGALVARAGEPLCRELYAFGIAAGMAFQLQDDYLDTFGDERTFGKQSGGDITANKKTFLYLKALELAEPSHKERLLQHYQSQPLDPSEKILEVSSIFRALDIPSEVRGLMQDYHEQAMKHLAMIEAARGPSPALQEFARKVMVRER